MLCVVFIKYCKIEYVFAVHLFVSCASRATELHHSQLPEAPLLQDGIAPLLSAVYLTMVDLTLKCFCNSISQFVVRHY